MKSGLIFIFVTISLFSCNHENNKVNEINSPYSKFLVKHFNDSVKNVTWKMIEKEKKKSVDSLLLEQDSLFVCVGENPLFNKAKNKVLKNPYFDKSVEYYHEWKNLPITYSVVYKNNLISLFSKGKFVCHDLKTIERNFDLERKLSLYEFENFWLYEGKLIALCNDKIYEWINEKWNLTDLKFPLLRSTKLFEDNDFVVFNDDFGEWGATVYFYHKRTRTVYFTLGFKVNGIFKNNNKYYVIEHKYSRGSKIVEIDNPLKLSVANPDKMFKQVKFRDGNSSENIGAYGYLDNSKVAKDVYDKDLLWLFSSFNIDNKSYYLGNIYELTFIAELKDDGKKVEIVHPFFKEDIYLRVPITDMQENYIVINSGRDRREESVILINKDEILKLDWNTLHN
ncbi:MULTISPECIES: hypothetical protein [unclassified Flavobacterium]|uniref:hypothetical protein n=1 Tax=unclassified Flavobacterium TaxID=196869 RepID=UPI001292AEBE|nr:MULTISPECIES: hypothetical protein [unclassified Flavobacterium]MQP52955.1 hypothetical protein [Flavobacterium sp. LMO9]MQP63156.1 hypothetical protein [Flavobacterium sp. LMO6]